MKLGNNERKKKIKSAKDEQKETKDL